MIKVAVVITKYIAKCNNGSIRGGRMDAQSKRAVDSLDLSPEGFSRKRANGPRKVAITRRQQD